MIHKLKPKIVGPVGGAHAPTGICRHTRSLDPSDCSFHTGCWLYREEEPGVCAIRVPAPRVLRETRERACHFLDPVQVLPSPVGWTASGRHGGEKR